MEPINNNHRTSHPLANSPHFVRVTRAQWEAEQAERYKFAFTPELKPLRANATGETRPRWQTDGRR
jgi:hypothetical protein